MIYVNVLKQFLITIHIFLTENNNSPGNHGNSGNMTHISVTELPGSHKIGQLKGNNSRTVEPGSCKLTLKAVPS